MLTRRFTFILIALATLAGCDRGAVPTLVGRPALDFTVKDKDRSVTLSQLRGKVVILNFWATWCPPCVDEVPALVQLQKQMADKVTVLAVSLDEDEAAYEKFVRDYGMAPLVNVRDADQRSSELYGTYKYPETYVIDKEGILRRKFIGPVEWTKPEIIEYLSKL
jgi:cytochrome c biogenesis protein CcmG, thiol:disulfide interchange protein DsbE